MNSYQVHAWYYPNFYTFSDILNGKRCKKSNKLYDDYINKKINRNTFTKNFNKLIHDYYNSKEVKDMNKCELDKCSSIIKKRLDYIAINIDYDIKDKYTLDDYINILTISEKILK